MSEILIDRIEASAKGSYVLVIRLEKALTIAYGKTTSRRFRAGYYLYSGSAMGGLKARVSRHLRCDKKHHWHIDHLLDEATVSDVLVVESAVRLECEIARILSGRYETIGGFGSSDCRCPGHLLFSDTPVLRQVQEKLTEEGIYPVRIGTNRYCEAE